uniref:Uncharacterized protein n=1 Tax=Rhizophagus irregularis (strain DAOM 181602 / DAOM 197198 / MUCL 43194) TaxID=747089 RepID=U9U205_RHIID
MEKAADEIISIDQPIVDPMKMIKSGINLDNSPNVDQSSKMEIVTDTPIMKQIEKTPMLQAISQSQNIIMDLTKSSNKKKKSNKNLVQQVITGHIPTDDGTSRVRDILVYDILVSWTPEEILKQLTLWGKTITKWTLKERKQRKKFQATIRNIPDFMTLATLWKDSCPHSFLSAWVDMRTTLDNQYTWEQNQRTSGSQQTQKKQQNSSKNSKKKPQETKSDKKSKKDKKDKFRKVSRSKVLRKL